MSHRIVPLVARNQRPRSFQSVLFNQATLQMRKKNGGGVMMIPLNPVQQREYQSAKRWANAGYLDTLVGVYEDPNYKMDLKSEEWRDGQQLYYLSEFGVMIISIPATFAILLGVAFITWYTFFDSQPTFLRNNPDPFLLIRNGRDTHRHRNPILAWTYKYGAHEPDPKISFYYEITDALNRKAAMKSAQKEKSRA